MSSRTAEFDAARREMTAGLAYCATVLEQARGDAALLTLRDLLLDFQFESRDMITAIEDRLGAFSGDDSPQALAAQSEALIEQVEGLQDAWESRVALLLNAGFAAAQPRAFLEDALANREGQAQLDEFFTGLPADMDQTGELLEYAKRYLLSLLDQRQQRGQRLARGSR
jgi:hypothetical protein